MQELQTVWESKLLPRLCKASRHSSSTPVVTAGADQLSCVRIVDDFFQNAAKGQLGHLAFCSFFCPFRNTSTGLDSLVQSCVRTHPDIPASFVCR